MTRVAVVSIGVIASLICVRDLRAQGREVEVCRELAGADGSGVCTVQNERGLGDEEFREFINQELELTEGASLSEVTIEDGVAKARFVAVPDMEVIGTLPIEDFPAAAWGPGAALGLGGAGLGAGLEFGLDNDDDGPSGQPTGAPGTPPGTPGPQRTSTPPRRGTPGPPATPPGQDTPGGGATRTPPAVTPTLPPVPTPTLSPVPTPTLPPVPTPTLPPVPTPTPPVSSGLE